MPFCARNTTDGGCLTFPSPGPSLDTSPSLGTVQGQKAVTHNSPCGSSSPALLPTFSSRSPGCRKDMAAGLLRSPPARQVGLCRRRMKVRRRASGREMFQAVQSKSAVASKHSLQFRPRNSRGEVSFHVSATGPTEQPLACNRGSKCPPGAGTRLGHSHGPWGVPPGKESYVCVTFILALGCPVRSPLPGLLRSPGGGLARWPRPTLGRLRSLGCCLRAWEPPRPESAAGFPVAAWLGRWPVGPFSLPGTISELL